MQEYINQYQEKLEEKYQAEIREKNKNHIHKVLQASINKEIYKDELYNCILLGSGYANWHYVVGFKQDSPQNSILSLKKAHELGEGFSTIGAKINLNTIKYDEYDQRFQQFISTDGEEILWGYRFSCLSDSINNWKSSDENQTNTPVGAYFDFNPQRLEHNKEKAIELGTAYTNPYQPDRRAMFNNLKGLGYIINNYNNDFYLGKMTIPTTDNYDPDAGDFMIYYLESFFQPTNQAFYPKKTYEYTISEDKKAIFDKLFVENAIIGNWSDEQTKIRDILKNNYGEKNPPNMFTMYLGIHDELQYCGTIKNPDWTLESGIIIPIQWVNDFYQKKFLDCDPEQMNDYKDLDGEALSLWTYLKKKKK